MPLSPALKTRFPWRVSLRGLDFEPDDADAVTAQRGLDLVVAEVRQAPLEQQRPSPAPGRTMLLTIVSALFNWSSRGTPPGSFSENPSIRTFEVPWTAKLP